MKLCLDVAISVGLDDARSKICVAIRRDDQPKIHEAPEEDLIILEAVEHIPESYAALQGGLSLIVL